jgi:hypothetical protein
MDGLVGFLNGPRARGAFLLQVVMDPPWSMRIQDQSPLSLITAIQGDVWIVPDPSDSGRSAGGATGAEPRRLRRGDVAIVRGPDPYLVADDPARAPNIVIHPGQHCTTVGGI